MQPAGLIPFEHKAPYPLLPDSKGQGAGAHRLWSQNGLGWMEPDGPLVSDTIAGDMILNTPTINTSTVKPEKQRENHLPLFLQRRQKERRRSIDLRGLFAKALPAIHQQGIDCKRTSRKEKKATQETGERLLV